MHFIDQSFINRISSKLQLFKKKRNNLFNFRCPLCGDSKKSKIKARAYLYSVKNDAFFKCHNCGSGHNLANFIKVVDPTVYKEYLLEKFKGKNITKKEKKVVLDVTPTKILSTPLLKLKSIDQLADTHPAKKFVIKRKIPEKYFTLLYYCPKFYEWCISVKPELFTKQKTDHPRLIIPFYDEKNKLFAFQGRSFGNEIPKYITVKFDENKEKIFGLERVDKTKDVYIVEGPIDSLFVDNALAIAGADTKLKVENSIYILDNEPRNREMIKRMKKIIDDNKSIVIWPETVKEKDINDMILSGKTKQSVMKIIKQNTYSGLSALTKFNQYKKI